MLFKTNKSLLGQASESGRRLAGQLLKKSAEPGWVGKTEGEGDFGYVLGAGAEKVPGFRDSSTEKVILIGHAHHFLENSRKVGPGKSLPFWQRRRDENWF